MTKAETKKQGSQRKQLVELLARTPIIQVCCEKVGVSRATFYRWKKESKTFAKSVDQAIIEGCQLINDFAESKLIEAIKDQNISAIFYWLNHRHAAYGNKVEVTANIRDDEAKLTPEQEANIRKALVMASPPEITEVSNAEKTKEV